MTYWTIHLHQQGYLNLDGGKIEIKRVPLLFEDEVSAYTFLVKNRGQLKHLGIPMDDLTMMGVQDYKTISGLNLIEVDLLWLTVKEL